MSDRGLGGGQRDSKSHATRQEAGRLLCGKTIPKESNSSLSLLPVSLCSQWEEGTAAQGKGLLGFLNWLLEGNEVDGETEVDRKSQIMGKAADTLWASEPCQAPASPSLCQNTASGLLSPALTLGDYHPDHLVSVPCTIQWI